MNQKIILRYSLAGTFIGYFVFHPLVMLLSYLMIPQSSALEMMSSDGIVSAIMKSFSYGMLPWSLSFALFNGVIGIYYATAKQENLAKKELILNLQKSLTEVKKLSGLLPICSSCKKIRNDEGYWQQIEEYIRDHSEADFTHGICIDCVKELYPELYPQFKKKWMLNSIHDEIYMISGIA